MMTTLSAMLKSRPENTIIGWLLLLVLPWLGACSSVRLAYDNGSQLAWWWLDGYVDFSPEQAPAARQGIDGLFAWHRSSQLPDYIAFLDAAQAQILDPTTPAAACRWQDLARERLDPTVERALALAADLLPGLGEAQFRSIEKRYAKVIAEMRDEFLQEDPAERQSASVARALERAERLYGRLDAAQKQVIEAGVAASPFHPELWLAERVRRQRETLETLRRLVAGKADRDQRLAALRVLAVRTERSPDAGYRAYQLELGAYNCAFAARIHNATTAAQRQRARDNLKGWQQDLQALAGRA
jgi:hypothetical protein